MFKNVEFNCRDRTHPAQHFPQRLEFLRYPPHYLLIKNYYKITFIAEKSYYFMHEMRSARKWSRKVGVLIDLGTMKIVKGRKWKKSYETVVIGWHWVQEMNLNRGSSEWRNFMSGNIYNFELTVISFIYFIADCFLANLCIIYCKFKILISSNDANELLISTHSEG